MSASMSETFSHNNTDPAIRGLQAVQSRVDVRDDNSLLTGTHYRCPSIRSDHPAICANVENYSRCKTAGGYSSRSRATNSLGAAVCLEPQQPISGDNAQPQQVELDHMMIHNTHIYMKTFR
jgi:hypothetical protein